MKILLVAINSKYIHSNPAVYLLRAYACEHLAAHEGIRETIEVAEYTINQQTEDILSDIYRRSPDVIAFSCYIWNIRVVQELLRDLPKVLPGLPTFLGGPEVSYDAPEVLREFPDVTGIMIGEGEVTFTEVAAYYLAKEPRSLADIAGLCLPTGVYTAERQPLPMDEVPFVFEEWAEDPDLGPFQNKILYYETSRGCPFRCSYCLSSIEKHLRLRSLEKVYGELQFFLDHKVSQVKLIDRTFNCNEDHALSIWKYIAAHDNGITNFHFEVAADIMTGAEMDVIKDMRPGLIQLEIGVQSTNADTIQEIRRSMDLAKLRANVARIHSYRNIHQHLDLIAGLPYEDYESFVKSFNDLYDMKPDQLQLGFLKVLKGAYMAEKTTDYGLQYTSEPPYEVLSTRWISYGQIRKLKQVESMVELYFNSCQFAKTLDILVTAFETPYAFFESLARYYEENGFYINQPSRSYRYQVLYEFASARTDLEEELVAELLTYDLYLRENAKSRPTFSRDLTEYRDILHQLSVDCGVDRRNHIEVFAYPVWEGAVEDVMTRSGQPLYLEFDYGSRDPLNKNAKTRILGTK